MSSLQVVTKSLVQSAPKASVQDHGLTARLALDDRTKHDAYAIRHASYLSGGFIDPMPGGIFSDPDDQRPNTRSVVVYKHGRAVASVRLCTLDNTPGLEGFDEIPASRIFPEAVQRLAASVPQPARLTEINRLVRHPDFATDYQLVFVLYRFAGFIVEHEKADMTLSCVRRNHTPFYKRLHFNYIDGPRKYAGVKFETNLMACPAAEYGSVASSIPFLGEATGENSAYKALLNGETVPVFDAA
jgi:hypothetical protein